MFNNPGGKIQDFAKLMFWLEVVGGAISGILVGGGIGEFEGFLAFLGIIIATGVVAYLSSLFLIAFGELVENSTIMANDVLRRKNGDKTDAETVEAEIHNEFVPTPITVNRYEQNSDMNSSNQEKLYQFALARIEAGKKFDLENAVRNLEAIPGYKDADELLQQCRKNLEMGIFK